MCQDESAKSETESVSRSRLDWIINNQKTAHLAWRWTKELENWSSCCLSRITLYDLAHISNWLSLSCSAFVIITRARSFLLFCPQLRHEVLWSVKREAFFLLGQVYPQEEATSIPRQQCELIMLSCKEIELEPFQRLSPLSSPSTFVQWIVNQAAKPADSHRHLANWKISAPKSLRLRSIYRLNYLAGVINSVEHKTSRTALWFPVMVCFGRFSALFLLAYAVFGVISERKTWLWWWILIVLRRLCAEDSVNWTKTS